MLEKTQCALCKILIIHPSLWAILKIANNQGFWSLSKRKVHTLLDFYNINSAPSVIILENKVIINLFYYSQDGCKEIK